VQVQFLRDAPKPVYRIPGMMDKRLLNAANYVPSVAQPHADIDILATDHCKWLLIEPAHLGEYTATHRQIRPSCPRNLAILKRPQTRRVKYLGELGNSPQPRRRLAVHDGSPGHRPDRPPA